ncbi:MAG: hypothetical protein V4690_03830 [Patescibacteria group bacterium]
MSNITSPSPFAVALKKLLDETQYFSRPQWARFLSVPEEKIEDWVSDRALPVSHIMKVIVEILEATTGTKKALKDFEEMSSMSSTEVSPFGEFMSPTVQEYLNVSLFVSYPERLRTLSPEQKVRVLGGSWDPDAIETYLKSR